MDKTLQLILLQHTNIVAFHTAPQSAKTVVFLNRVPRERTKHLRWQLPDTSVQKFELLSQKRKAMILLTTTK